MSAYTFDATDRRSTNTLIGKVFGVMFVGLFLTAIIALGAGMIFSYAIFGTLKVGDFNYYDVENNMNIGAIQGFLIVLIISAVALLITSIVIHIVFLRGKHSLLIPVTLYVGLMGLVLSELVIFLPWEILGITFLITSSVFGIMFLISYLSKGNLGILGLIGIGLLVGSAFIGLVGLLFMLTGLLGDYIMLYWIVSIASFAGMMFITIWDMWRIKVIAEQGSMSSNLVLYCAFTLYVDFIYIFLRVLRIVAYFYSKKR
ncbi:MAG: Bax inhibitor-1 family protein [Bacilli bacterium]|nr:Bax inhibitor-1 family protein [Bacilli bacterium]